VGDPDDNRANVQVLVNDHPPLRFGDERLFPMYFAYADDNPDFEL